MHRKMRTLILAVVLVCGVQFAAAQCIVFEAQGSPVITPQPGGWTFQPGRGIPLHLGDTPFPGPVSANDGQLVLWYTGTHNNPGRTCNWRNVDMIMVVVTSFETQEATVGERSDTFQFQFNVNASFAAFTMELNDRWIKRIDVIARNPFGLSGPTRSEYASLQYTGNYEQEASLK